MSSATLRAKIASGLAKAKAKVGSGASEKVYLLSKVTSPGTPLNPGTVTSNQVELLNALFRSYDKTLRDDNIQQGDRELISQYDVEIKAGDTIIQGSKKYLVIAVEPVAPTSDKLLYRSQLRQQ